MEDLGGAFFEEDWMILFDGVDFGDVITEIGVRIFPIGGRGRTSSTPRRNTTFHAKAS